MLKLIIGNKNYSSWSLRPWLLLQHFGVVFEEVRIPLDTPEFQTKIGNWSPSRKVPVLHDDSLVVWDSLAICEYVNDRYLDGRGWPVDVNARAVARSAACEMHSGFPALRAQLPMNCRRQVKAKHWDAAADRDIERVIQLWRELRSAVDQQTNFLCGPFSIVDAMFAPVVLRFRSYGVATDAVCERYMNAILALPSMQTWLAQAINESERLAYENI